MRRNASFECIAIQIERDEAETEVRKEPDWTGVRTCSDFCSRSLARYHCPASRLHIVRSATIPPLGLSVRATVAACSLAIVAAVLGSANVIGMPLLNGLYPVSGLGLPLLVISMYALIPSLLYLGALIWMSIRGRSVAPGLVWRPLAAAAAIGFGFGNLGGGWWFERNTPRLLDAAIAFYDGARPSLERYRMQHGVYPERIDLAAEVDEAPLLVRTGDAGYRADKESYAISINTSRGLSFFGATFDSDTGEWTRSPTSER